MSLVDSDLDADRSRERPGDLDWRCLDGDAQRRIEDQLRVDGKRATRPLLLALVLVVVSVWAAYARAATVTWGCVPSTQDVYGNPLPAPPSYEVTIRSVDASQLITQAIQCTNPVSVTVPDPPGTLYSLATTAMNAAGYSYPSSGLRLASVAVAPPVPKALLTVGGDVFQASVNWTNFSFKLGAKVGTIAARQKCDVTRRIGADHYRVTAPIVWTAGKKDYVVAKCEAV